MAGPKKPREEPNVVPGWIVSFSDMVTLLLAFFVLLQTFAKVQDDELFHAGRGSFRRAVSGMGMSNWFGGQMAPPLTNFRKLKYPTPTKDNENSHDRIIDLEDEQINQIFKSLSDSMDMKSLDVAAEVINVHNTSVTFPLGRTGLDDAAKKYLTQLAGDLKRTTDRNSVKLYVIGLAADVDTRKDQFILSARRAAEVQQFLVDALSPDASEKWDVYSWGAGKGGQWCNAYGLAPQGVKGGTDCIAVAIMSAADKGGR